MAVAHYLVDKSAWARAAHPLVAAILERHINRGMIGTSGIVDLELLFSARNGREHDEYTEDRKEFDWYPTTDDVVSRAIEVQNQLAHKGCHRAVSIPDLLVAATAERHQLTLLHYDGDFDMIAEVTGQATEWIVPRGTAD
jgi:predicted nucleic acid-binding protein